MVYKDNFQEGDRFWLGDEELAYAVVAQKDLCISEVLGAFKQTAYYKHSELMMYQQWLQQQGYIGEIECVRVFVEKAQSDEQT